MTLLEQASINPIQTLARASLERLQTNTTMTLRPGSNAGFLFVIMYRFCLSPPKQRPLPGVWGERRIS